MKTETDEKTAELGENDTAQWMGFTIKRKRDFGARPEIGYVVTVGGCNVMPGATWFRSVSEARKGIAAYILACRIASSDKTCDGDTFWALMELTR